MAPDQNRVIVLTRPVEGNKGWMLVKYDTKNKVAEVAKPTNIPELTHPENAGNDLVAPSTFGKRSGSAIPLTAKNAQGEAQYEYDYIANSIDITKLCTVQTAEGKKPATTCQDL